MRSTLAELVAQADALADRCERSAPRSPGHAGAVARLRTADARARSEAVAAARREGMSWAAIALVLGLPTDECRRRHDGR